MGSHVVQKLIVKIEKLVQGGYGLARQAERTVFVRGAVPGETVEISVGATHKHYQEAVVSRVVEASSDRVVPPCAVYGRCGGCQLQHMRYETQLHWKREMLVETLVRVGKLTLPEVPPLVRAGQEYGSRYVVRFGVMRHGKGFALGLHQEGSAKLVVVPDCTVLPEVMLKIVRGLQERLGALTRPACRIDSIEVRASEVFGQALLLFRTQAISSRQADALCALTQGLPGVVGLVVTGRADRRGARWVQGQEWIAERLDDMVIRVSDRSTYPSNWPVYHAISKTVTEWVTPQTGLRVLDLHAGIGMLGLPLAKRGAFLTAAESNPFALADARRAANGNHIGRCRFRPVRPDVFLTTAAKDDYDVILADPPRTGFTREAIADLGRLAVPRLLYLSSDPATLARDASRLCALSYRLSRVQAFDMAPQTASLVTLVELQSIPR